MVLNVHLTRPWGDVLEEKIRSYIFSTAVLRHQWIIHWDRIFYFSVTKKEQSSRQLYSRGGALVFSSGFLLFELPDLSQDYFFHSQEILAGDVIMIKCPLFCVFPFLTHPPSLQKETEKEKRASVRSNVFCAKIFLS